MRKTALIVAFLAAAGATQARAETIYIGEAIVLAVTPACNETIAVDDFAKLTYRPAYKGFGNGADSYLAYVPGRASFAMMVPNNTFRARINYAGQSTGSRLTVATRVGGVLDWQQDPATPSLADKTIALTASIANFWALRGCTVTLRANLLRVKSNPGEVLD